MFYWLVVHKDKRVSTISSSHSHAVWELEESYGKDYPGAKFVPTSKEIALAADFAVDCGGKVSDARNRLLLLADAIKKA